MSMFAGPLSMLSAGGAGGGGFASALGPIGMAAGLGLGAIGSFMGAQSANRAARTASTIQQYGAKEQQARIGGIEMGPEDYRDMLLALAPVQMDANGTGRLVYQDPFLANGHWKFVTPEVEAARTRFTQKYPSMQAVMAQANPRLIGDQEALLQRERDRTGTLDRMAKEAEGVGTDLEAREKARIYRDSERDLKGLDRRSKAALGLSGSNTLIGNQMASNQRQIGYQRDDALLEAAKAATARLLQARGVRMQQLGQRYGLEGNLEDQLAKLRYSLALAPAQSRAGVVGGSAFNPVAQSPAAYGQYNPTANAFASLGPALAQLGGQHTRF